MPYGAGGAPDQYGRAFADKLQQRLVKTAHRHGMRLLGPHFLGIYNARSGWYPTFPSAFGKGPAATRAHRHRRQSGALGSCLAALARDRGRGAPVCVTTSNEGYVDDPETDVIMAYAEGIKHTASFVCALKAARRARKLVVVMKVGSSVLGNQAAALHTAPIAGDVVVTDAVLREFGPLRARSAEEILDTAYAASYDVFPLPNTLGVMTLSGEVGVLVRDVAEDLGIAMPSCRRPRRTSSRSWYPSPPRSTLWTARPGQSTTLLWSPRARAHLQRSAHPAPSRTPRGLP